MDPDKKGYVFDIQHYSIHDGPGIRTTVFLSGCSLRCKWCQNPESHLFKPQLLFFQEKCTACMLCVDKCPRGAILFDGNRISNDRSLCDACGICVSVCPFGARTITGREMTAAGVFFDVDSDRIFYDGSGGGATLSGGEVLVQPEFAASILQLCRIAGLSTAVETTGNAKWPIVESVLKHADLILYDLKHMDSDQHKAGTGVPNELILENIKRIKKELKKDICIRIPVIPGYNDSDENISRTAAFIINELGPDTPVNLLPYHRMGTAKWEQLEKDEPVFESETPDEKHMKRLKDILESYGLSVEES